MIDANYFTTDKSKHGWQLDEIVRITNKSIRDCRSVPVDIIANFIDVLLDITNELPPEISGSLGLDRHELTMWINANDSNEKQRFTIACLLGQHIIHPSMSMVIKSGRDVDNFPDSAVPAFAAKLLLPQELVDNCMLMCDGDLNRAAKMLKVTVDALKIWLSPFGII